MRANRLTCQHLTITKHVFVLENASRSIDPDKLTLTIVSLGLLLDLSFSPLLPLPFVPSSRLPQLYTPPDPTYGRYLLPCLPEEEYLSNHPLVKTTRRRIFINAAATGSNPAYPKSEAIHLLPEEVVPGKEFVHWLGWELEDRRGLVGEGIDVLVQHGIGDYSGRWSIHIA